MDPFARVWDAMVGKMGMRDGSKAKIDPDPARTLACGHLTIPDHRSGISVD